MGGKENKNRWRQVKIPAVIHGDLEELKDVLREQYPTKNWKWEDVFRFLIYLARVATKLEHSPRFSQETAEPFKYSRIDRLIEDARKMSEEFPTIFDGVVLELLRISTEQKRKADVRNFLDFAERVCDMSKNLVYYTTSEIEDSKKQQVETYLGKLVENGYDEEAIAFSMK